MAPLNENLLPIYKEYTDYLRHHEALLFQRLNYFLVGNSFLTVAFGALAVGYINGSHAIALFILGCIVAISGFLMSWSFIVINFLGGLHLRAINLETEKIERDLVNNGDIKRYYPHCFLIEQTLRKRKYSGYFLWAFISFPIRGVIEIIRGQRKDSDCDVPAPATWIIPWLFVLFWVAIGLVFYFFAYKVPLQTFM